MGTAFLQCKLHQGPSGPPWRGWRALGGGRTGQRNSQAKAQQRLHRTRCVPWVLSVVSGGGTKKEQDWLPAPEVNLHPYLATGLPEPRPSGDTTGYSTLATNVTLTLKPEEREDGGRGLTEASSQGVQVWKAGTPT